MRKKHFLAFLLVIALLLSACTEADIMDNSIKGFMTVLSSDELKGRITGSKENELTAAYLAYKFEKFGLEPLKGDSYFHEYKQSTARPENQIHTMTIEFQNGTSKECIYGEDFVVRMGLSKFSVSVPITFDMKDSSLTGKIAVIDDLRKDLAAARTSKCVLIKTPVFTGVPPRYEKNPATVPLISISDKLYTELKTKYIKNLKINIDYTWEEINAKNVVGKISGTNHKKALILSSHMDGVGYAGNTIYNGAIDNASGTAVILDLAQRLSEKSKEKPFEMDILICAFNGEEYMLLGSGAFAQDIKNQYEEINNINIDCVGKKDGGSIVLGGEDYNYKEFMDEVVRYITTHGLSYAADNYGASDHMSFNNNSICGITIGQQGLYDGKKIHTSMDKLNNVDFEMIKKVSDAVYDYIINHDGKLYKSQPSSSNPMGGPSMEFINKVTKMDEEEKAKLNYDEYKILQVDDFLCTFVGNKPFTSLDALKKYFPDIKLQLNILGYDFSNAFIGNTLLSPGFTNKGAKISEELGKVYKVNLSLKDVVCINTMYEKDNSVLSINAYKKCEFTEGELAYIMEQYTTEKATVNGRDISILVSNQSKKAEGANITLNINGKDYIMFISKGIKFETQIGTTKTTTINYETTKDEIINIVKGINLDELIKNLGF